MPKVELNGLNNQEIQDRITKGEVNKVNLSITKSIKQIFFENTLTLFNIINIVIAALIITTGSYKNILFLGVVVINTTIGIYQELKAKRSIDNLSILNQSKVTAIRNSEEIQINQDDIVLDDILTLETGQQIVVDGVIISTAGLECDESALTGESDSIYKQDNDIVYSGSYIVSGKAIMKVSHVGQDSYVSKLTLKAKEDNEVQSELIRSLKKIIRLLTFFIIPIGAILFAASILKDINLTQAILGSTAAMIGMIPEGLILLTSIALAVGALRLTRQKVLIKSIGSIETLARVDVLCLDKTGTLTTNKLKVIEVISLDKNKNINDIISQVVFDLNESNPTALALQDYFSKPTTTLKNLNIIPFSSKRKWSAIQYESETYYLGAPDFLTKNFSKEENELVTKYTSDGLRVLALAKGKQALNHDTIEDNLTTISLIVLEDEIRPTAKNTLEYFKMQDVDIKIISGDFFKTVEKIAKKAGLPSTSKAIDMSKINEDDDYQKIANDYQIFGRVSPEQKRLLVKGLQDNNHTVGMTGDGINDILALKKADCSIVMNNATDAVKGISDFVLLDSNFDSMIKVVLEGRRVINNIQRVASLYLTKTVYSIVLAIFFIFISRPYPFQPIQLTPINALTVGIPSFFLALRSNFSLIKGDFFKNALEPSLASGFSIVIYILIIQILGSIFNFSYLETSTLSVLMTGIVCFVALSYIARPLNNLIKGMIVVLITIFILLFSFFPNFLAIEPIFQIHLALIYIPLIITTVPLFYGLKSLSKKILKN